MWKVKSIDDFKRRIEEHCFYSFEEAKSGFRDIISILFHQIEYVTERQSFCFSNFFQFDDNILHVCHVFLLVSKLEQRCVFGTSFSIYRMLQSKKRKEHSYGYKRIHRALY